MSPEGIAAVLSAAGDLTLKGFMALAIFYLWRAWRDERAAREADNDQCAAAREELRIEHAKDLRATIASMDGQIERVRTSLGGNQP